MSPALKWPEMTSTSHCTLRLQEERSQSGRPFSTSSTNSYSPFGRRARNVSFSSAELTVMVQTVFFCDGAAKAALQARKPRRTKAKVARNIEADR